MATVLLPRPVDLEAAPERAALALLDAALAVARAALLAHNPDVVSLGDPHYGRDLPRTTLLAARLAARTDALHELVAAYLAALDDLERDEHDMPF
jgi:hypothetical protein